VFTELGTHASGISHMNDEINISTQMRKVQITERERDFDGTAEERSCTFRIK
jgi:hypothetical protein